MDDIKYNPSFLDKRSSPLDDDDDDDGDENPVRDVFKMNVVIFGVALIVSLIAVVLTFFTAPAVGGEWWPYIHFLTTFVVGVIAFYITAAVMTIIVVRSFMREWF